MYRQIISIKEDTPADVLEELAAIAELGGFKMSARNHISLFLRVKKKCMGV